MTGVENLWVGFGDSDGGGGNPSYSMFFKLDMMNSETVAIELDNMTAYQGMIGGCPACVIPADGMTWDTATMNIMSFVYPISSMPSQITAWTELNGKPIYDNGGKLYVDLSVELDYTKFVIHPDYANNQGAFFYLYCKIY